MSIAMDGSDISAGCVCEVGLTVSELAYITDELDKWLREKHLTHRTEEWRQGFHEGIRIALANILKMQIAKEVDCE